MKTTHTDDVHIDITAPEFTQGKAKSEEEDRLRCPTTSFGIVAVVDLLVVLLLLVALPERASSWSFKEGTLDLVLSCALRIVCFPAFGLLAVWLGKPPTTPSLSPMGVELDNEAEGAVLVQPAGGYIGVSSASNTAEEVAEAAKEEAKREKQVPRAIQYCSWF